MLGVGSAEAHESSLGLWSSRVKKDKRPDTSFVRPEDSGSITSILTRGRGRSRTVAGGRGGSGRRSRAGRRGTVAGSDRSPVDSVSFLQQSLCLPAKDWPLANF